MIISHKHKFIYIAIDKTGTTSIEQALDKYNQESLEKHTTISEAKKELNLNLKDYFIFCFIRNPWDRIHSKYHQIRKPNDLQNPSRKKLYDESNSMEFNEYLLYEISIKRNLHWSQYKYFTDEDGKILANYIGKFENLENDFNEVCKILKIPHQTLSHKNQTKKESYKLAYNDETRERVAEICKKDIELGNYTF